ncbi:MAG TPA: hypothetical protein VGB07_36160 [Blastocatellia bacterium]
MTDIATQILAISRLAQAPPHDFKPWQIAKVVQTPWQSGVGVEVLSYQVPKGFSLVVTRVDSWVSEAYNVAATPGTPKPVQSVINWPPGFTARWQINSDVIAGRLSLYTVLGAGEQLIVFPPRTLAKFVMVYSGPNQVAAEEAFQFRFFGFLTLPEHSERLIPNQSLTP